MDCSTNGYNSFISTIPDPLSGVTYRIDFYNPDYIQLDKDLDMMKACGFTILRIDAVMRGLDMRVNIPTDYFLEVLGLNVISNRAEAINVWGINPKNAGRLVSMAVLPILSYVLKYLVQIYFPGILVL